MDDKIRQMLSRIEWLGHGSMKIKASKVIYIDPWKLAAGSGGDGDIVLVTHDHYDHLSIPDIRKALKKGGKVMVAECCREKYPAADVFTLPYMKHRVDGVDIYATAAYNINKPFHPREAGNVGYIINIDGVKIYHAGDTDAFPHMRDFECDIAILPVSGTYVMNPADAVDAVNMLKPQVAVPVHWGDPDVVGTRADAEKFKELAPCEVVILNSLR